MTDGSTDYKQGLTTLWRSAALFIVIIREWLQPSGFTQNVERTKGIVSR